MKKFDYYQPSGNISWGSTPVLLLFWLLVFPLFGALYGFLLHVSGFLLLNLAFFIGAVYVFLFLQSAMLTAGNVRNGNLAFISGSIAFFAFYYMHWVVFIDLEFTDILLKIYDTEKAEEIESLVLGWQKLMIDPDKVWGFIMLYKEAFTWKFFFWVYTIIEVVVFLFIAFISWTSITEMPFSEINDTWHKSISSPKLALINKNKFLEAISARDFDYLASLTRPKKHRESHSIIELYQSPGDQSYVVLKKKLVETGKQGSVSFSEIPEIEYLAIDPDEEKAMLEVFKKLRKSKPVSQSEPYPESSETTSADEKAIKETVVVEERPEERIEEPALAINVNSKTTGGRTFGGFISVAVGVILIAISSGDYTHTEGLIFGVILCITGFIQFFSSLSSSTNSKVGYAIKLTPSTVVLGGVLTTNSVDFTFDLSQIELVDTSVSQGGTVSMTILTRDEIYHGKDVISLDIAMADYDSILLKTELRRLIGKEVYERQEILRDWLKRKPSLLF